MINLKFFMFILTERDYLMGRDVNRDDCEVFYLIF